MIEVAAQCHTGGQLQLAPAGERVVPGALDEVPQRALDAAERIVVFEGAAVREDVAQDAVLGVVDLASGERDRAVRGGEGPRGCDDATAGVVGELDAAGVVVDACELAAGERAAAVVVMPTSPTCAPAEL